MTPLIDTVFILLIFFLVTASFTKESGINVNRPQAETAVREENAGMIIGITESGEIWLANQVIELPLVRAHIERLQAQNPEGSVVILADQDTPTGVMIAVLDQVRAAGVSNVSVAATAKQ